MVDAADGGGGGGFQGIDPASLATLMGSMKNGTGAAQPAAGGYLGRFGGLGLDTGPVNKLLADYSWATSQQPMLQRRYNLASHQPSGQWIGGMATSGAGDLQFATSAQAQAAGADAAKKFRDGKLSEADFLAQLRQHQGDPDWQTGAMRQLGTDGLWQIRQEGLPPDSNEQANMQALASAVAAAMANGVKFPDEGSDDPDSVDMEDIAPLLQYADFPPSVLAQLGREAMAPGYSMYSPMVWNALAKSPEGAALFIRDNAEDIMYYVKAGDHGGGLPDDYQAAFTSMLKAGTVGIKATDPKLGGQAVTALIKAADKDQDKHVPGQMEAVFGQVVQAYWPDVIFSLTSKASGSDPHGYLTSPDGMQLSPSDWGPFIQEAMRDPRTSASLLATAHTQSTTWQDQAAGMAGKNAGDVYEWNAGVVAGYFDYQAKETYSKLVEEGKDAGEWKDKVSDYVGDAVGLGVDIVADPGEGIVKPVVKKVTEVAITDALKFGIGSIPTDGSKPPSPHYSDWQGGWADNAATYFNKSTLAIRNADPARAAMWQSAQGQPFVVNGQIPPTEDMTPAQLTAYNNWLDSPAVGTLLLNDGPQDAWQGGYNSTVIQEGFAGGGG
jgi:hypothetical protein